VPVGVVSIDTIHINDMPSSAGVVNPTTKVLVLDDAALSSSSSSSSSSHIIVS
jgi:hypothetical protein